MKITTILLIGFSFLISGVSLFGQPNNLKRQIPVTIDCGDDSVVIDSFMTAPNTISTFGMTPIRGMISIDFNPTTEFSTVTYTADDINTFQSDLLNLQICPPNMICYENMYEIIKECRVPTLSEWGLIILLLLFMTLGTLSIQQIDSWAKLINHIESFSNQTYIWFLALWSFTLLLILMIYGEVTLIDSFCSIFSTALLVLILAPLLASLKIGKQETDELNYNV